MMRNLSFLVVAALTAFSLSSANADVTVTFDSDLESFVKNSDSTAVAWSAVNGGAMAITANGGWAGNSVSWGGAPDGSGGTTFGLNTDPVMWAELQAALVNGGTISYDLIVNEADVIYDINSPPQWFESVMVFNSNGGWDQEVINHGLNGGSWPLAGGTFTDTVTLDILPGAAAADGASNIDDSAGWANLHFGLNNDGGSITSATVYIDNITVSANAVPEPTTFGLLAIGAAALVTRRRR